LISMYRFIVHGDADKDELFTRILRWAELGDRHHDHRASQEFKDEHSCVVDPTSRGRLVRTLRVLLAAEVVQKHRAIAARLAALIDQICGSERGAGREGV